MFNYRRVQLGGALVASIFIPLLIVAIVGSKTINITSFLDNIGIYNSIIACVASIFYGFFSWSRLSKMHSSQNISYLIWAFLPYFVLSVTALSFFRLEYSRVFVLCSASTCFLWFWLVQNASTGTNDVKFLLIPGGGVEKIREIKRLKWEWIGRYEEFFDELIGRPVDRRTAIVADLSFNHDLNSRRFIANAVLKQIPVYHYKILLEEITGRCNIEHLSENAFGSTLPNSSYMRLRRILDIFFTIIALPIVVPILILAITILLFVDGRPIIFKQDRVGFRGETFKAWKLRTMRTERDESAGKLLAVKDTDLRRIDAESHTFLLEEPAGPDGLSAITLENDPRITPLGRFLRKSRIDELPQIYNILAGSMSWIGPRPEALELARMYEKQIPFYSYRHTVRPGISGWAQVMQGHVTSVDDVRQKLQYDFYYIKHFSPLLDLLIVIKTIKTVFFGIGAK